MRRGKSDRGSIWMTPSASADALPALKRDERADVCIVGAGIFGLTTAYLLGASGRSVIVLEREQIGAGETGRTTAHLTAVLDTRYARLKELHGEERARLAASSHSAAIDLLETTVRSEGIDCGFERVDGYLIAADADAAEELEKERDAAQAAGLRVELVARAPLPFEAGPALRIRNQGQFDPLCYLAGLARSVARLGGRLVRARAVQIDDDDAVIVRCEQGLSVRAAAVVIATHSPISERIGVHAKQTPYRTYVVAAPVDRGSVQPGLYWDTLDAYHYVRVVSAKEQDVLLVGGEDHKTGQADDADERFARLERWAKERFGSIRAISHRWSGQVLEPSDGLAYIGRSDGSSVYVATGFGGNGMTYGTLAGHLVADQLLGRDNAWASLYDPGRLTAKAAASYAEAGVDVVAKYGERLSGGEIESPREVPAGGGAVMRRGLTKVAVHRDAADRVYEVSAICTHLGCVVHWNASEKSWDCPCHGSRFAPDGSVLNGPATKPLAPAAEEDATAVSSRRRTR